MMHLLVVRSDNFLPTFDSYGSIFSGLTFYFGVDYIGNGATFVPAVNGIFYDFSSSIDINLFSVLTGPCYKLSTDWS
jgi:hypothetical protein